MSSAQAQMIPTVPEQHAFLDRAKYNDGSGENIALIQELVSANRLYVNVRPSNRWSALMQAAYLKQEAHFIWLLAHGADVRPVLANPDLINFGTRMVQSKAAATIQEHWRKFVEQRSVKARRAFHNRLWSDY